MGGKAATGAGLSDMSGNAGEWRWDWYGDRVGPGPADNPAGPASGADRVGRGGRTPGLRDNGLGSRVVPRPCVQIKTAVLAADGGCRRICVKGVPVQVKSKTGDPHHFEAGLSTRGVRRSTGRVSRSTNQVILSTNRARLTHKRRNLPQRRIRRIRFLCPKQKRDLKPLSGVLGVKKWRIRPYNFPPYSGSLWG
ncbi:MAG: formylglycine-generating enzyme family protein, partial [Treponema sp.]|nr:formylglycine-generating enzyme family protein [Treponema sp.]